MNQFYIYISYSHPIIIALCFFVFEKVYKQKFRDILLFLLLVIAGVVVGYIYSVIDLLVLFVLLFTFSYLKSPQENPMQIILSIMCSAIIEIMLTPLQTGVFYHTFFLDDEVAANIILSLLILLSLVICLSAAIVIRDKLYPYWKRAGHLDSVAFSLMIAVLTYQTIQMVQLYGENQNSAFLLLLFYLILSGLIIMIVRTLAKNVVLEANAKNDQIIAELQKQYVEEVKKQYQETRKFRHDYTNLLSTINYYLENDEIPELKEYFSNDVMKTNAVLKENNLILDSLQNIESIGIRSIFYTKLLLAQEKNIDIQIEIREFLPEKKNAGTISLVRLFGIFLDNAIEELASIREGSLIIVAFKENNDIVFIIQNTTRNNIESLQDLKKEGFSTRGEKRGLGLSNVEEILAAEPSVLLETKIKDQLFIQKITILSEVK